VREKSMRKYTKIVLEDEYLLQKYLESPLNALLKDNELRIISLLKGIEKNISNDSIELKDKKRKKTLAKIKELDKDFFDDFLKKYNDIKEKLNETNKKINKMDIKGKILNKEKELEELNINIEKIENDIENLKNEIEKIDIDEIKKDIENNIENIFNIEVEIS